LGYWLFETIWLAFFFGVGGLGVWMFMRPFNCFRAVFIAPFLRLGGPTAMTHGAWSMVQYFRTNENEKDDGTLGAKRWFKVRRAVRAMALVMAILAFGLLLTVPISRLLT